MTNAQALDKMTLKELGALALSHNLKGWTNLRKKGLIEFLSEQLPVPTSSDRSSSPAESDAPSSDRSTPAPRRRRRTSKSVPSSEETAPSLFDVMLEDEQNASNKGAKKGSKSVVEKDAKEDQDKPTRGRRKRSSTAVDEPKSKAKSAKQVPEEPKQVPKTDPQPKRQGRKKRQTTGALAEATEQETPALTSVVETIVKASDKGTEADVQLNAPPAEEAPRKKRAYRRRKSEVAPIEPVEKNAEENVAKNVGTTEPVASAPQESVQAKEQTDQAVVEQAAQAEPTVKPKRTYTRRRAKKTQDVVPTDAPSSGSSLEKETESEPKESTEPESIVSEKAQRDEKENESATETDASEETLGEAERQEEQSGTQSESTESNPAPSEEVLSLREKLRLQKVIGSPHDQNDRLVLMVCDSYWLRACWEITPQLVDRVRSAMGRYWHTADPILRVYLVDKAPQTASIRREHYADLEIRGGVDNWYVPVDDPPSCFMVELGYKSRDQQFFTLISSNIVETPQRCLHDEFGRSVFGGFSPDSTLDSFSRVNSRSGVSRTFAEQDDDFPAQRPSARFAQSHDSSSFFWQSDPFRLEVDAEVVVKGRATPGSTVRVKDEPLRLANDGSFSIRFSLPERRHVFPVVAQSPDGVETQTVVLAVDRNTKTLDPVYKEDEEE